MASCHFLRFMEQTQKKTVRLLRKGKPSVCQLRQSDHTTRAQKGVERKQLCFNCTGANHKAPECRCSACCKFCNQRHHSSICPKKIPQQSPETMLVVTGKGSVTYPVVIVSVGGIHWCWKLLRICCLARLHGETASSKRVQTHRNDDASEQQRDQDVVISTWRGNFSFEPK